MGDPNDVGRGGRRKFWGIVMVLLDDSQVSIQIKQLGD